MDTQMISMTALASIMFMGFFGVIFVIPIVIGKMKKLSHPFQFGFVCGSLALGIQAVVAILVVPFAVFGTFIMPNFYQEGSFLFIAEIQELFENYWLFLDSVFLFTLSFVIPMKLGESKWVVYEKAIDSNQ